MSQNHKPDCPWYGIMQDDLTDDELDSLDEMPCICSEQLRTELADIASTSLKSLWDAE